jgi:hypothetical protein
MKSLVTVSHGRSGGGIGWSGPRGGFVECFLQMHVSQVEM